MSRPSAAALAIAPPAPEAKAPASDGLTPAEAQIWNDLIAAVPVNHFVPSDYPLLRTYVEVVARLREAKKHLAKGIVIGRGKTERPSPWLRIYGQTVQLQAMLALRLRLAPTSRLERKSQARQAAAPLPAGPWNT